MREIKLPAYPLITFDPLMSIWSMTDTLSASDTRMWTNKDKPIRGYLVVDGTAYRFMGTGKTPAVTQKKIELGLTSTRYVFENETVAMTVEFTTPFLLDDLKISSRPVSYVTVFLRSKDGKRHLVDVVFAIGESLVYRKKRRVVGGIEQIAGGNLGYLMRRKQEPLLNAGDRVETDWGTVYAAGAAKIALCSPSALTKYLKGASVLTGRGLRKDLIVEKSGVIDAKTNVDYHFCIAWDDGYSIEYFGKATPGYWKKFYPDIRDAIRDALGEYKSVMQKCKELDERTEKEIVPLFGSAYYALLVASYRQAIAAHKLIEADGRPVLISKENSSNGCAATVDVTYPSAPLFLVEKPILLRAMLEPIVKFARMPVWKFDFAPHDAGIYPYVMGQVYAMDGKFKRTSLRSKCPPVFQYTDGDAVFKFKNQMPVEESANMIILSAAYFNETGDRKFIMENADLLEKWANYLISQGIELSNQLSTDDFSGWLPKNVNLAVKSVIAVALWGKLREKALRKEEGDYRRKAEEMTAELLEKADRGDRLAIVLDKEEGWSTKYNLVWDKMFTHLFPEEVYRREIAYYKTKLNKYGLPLDGRKTYCKSDWMIWASVLDDSEATLREYAETLVKMLAESEIRLPYPDLFETVAPKFGPGGGNPMYARTVQGGMWLPIYAYRLTKPGKKNFLI